MRHRLLRAGSLPLLLLVALTLVVYGQVGSFDFITHDDDDYVTANGTVKQGLTSAGLRWALTSFAATNWHPLTWVSHMLDVELFGLDAGGHHLTSLLLHVLNTLLFWLLMRRLSCGAWPATFAAGLFALHPIQVESVAWIAERKNVLSTLFFLLALLAHLSYARRGGAGRALAVVAFAALGLLSKPMLVTLPFVLLLLDLWPLGRLGWRTVLEKVPLFLLSAASAWMTLAAQHAGGAVQDLGAIGLAPRVANAAVSYVRYLGKLVWPANLALEYAHPALVSGGLGWSVATVTLCSALFLLLSIGALFLSRSERLRYVTVGWLWYVGTLVPVIGIVQVGSQAMADRYAYVPFLGLFLIAGFGAADLLARVHLDRRLVGLSLVAILCACTVLTWRQAALWRDSQTIYLRSLSRVGESWKLLYELAVLRSTEGQLDEALGYFERAVRVNPTNPHLQRNLGVMLQQRGRLPEAISHFEQAVRASPSYVRGHFALGLAFGAAGRLADGVASLGEAVRLDESFAEGHHELGRLLARNGRPRQALASLERAASLRPGWAAPLAAMAEILAAPPDPSLHDPVRALDLAERATALEGGDEPFVLMSLAGAYHANGRVGEAIRAAEQAERRAIEKSQPALARRIASEIARYRAGS